MKTILARYHFTQLIKKKKLEGTLFRAIKVLRVPFSLESLWSVLVN